MQSVHALYDHDLEATVLLEWLLGLALVAALRRMVKQLCVYKTALWFVHSQELWFNIGCIMVHWFMMHRLHHGLTFSNHDVKQELNFGYTFWFMNLPLLVYHLQGSSCQPIHYRGIFTVPQREAGAVGAGCSRVQLGGGK